MLCFFFCCFFFFQAEDGIRDLVRSRGLGDVYKRQVLYDFTVRDGVEQHVGIYIGDLDGVPQIIDSSSDKENHYYVQIRNIDCTTTKKTTETVGTDSIVTIRRITP